MKKHLHIFSIAVLLAGITMMMTACSSSSKKEAGNLVLSATDTTGLADFQSWKAGKDADNYYMASSQNAPVNNTVRKTTPVRKVSTPATTQPVAQKAKKKGWSKAAKATVIGTATGAIAGVLINKKNRVLGGVIGGVLGGGIGYGIGRGMDKKDGRY
jgi:hypothetical protein